MSKWLSIIFIYTMPQAWLDLSKHTARLDLDVCIK